MKELSIRALAGAFLVAVIVGATLAGEFTLALLFLPVCAIAGDEFHRLVGDRADGPHAAWTVALSATGFLAVALSSFIASWGVAEGVAFCLSVLLPFLVAVLIHDPNQAARSAGNALLALLLIGVPFGLLVHLRAMDTWLLLGFLLLLWTSDTAAYLVGKGVGRTKLLPHVSPGKTVEGTVGGLVATVALGWYFQSEALGPIGTPWVMGAAVISLSGVVGDLLESALKRNAGVKDSGHVIPGHGGLLDRFDALLLAAPCWVLVLHLHH